MLDVLGWQPLALPWVGELRDASRAEAQAVYDTLMATRGERVAGLVALAARHQVELDAADATDRAGAWLIACANAAGPEAVDSAGWQGLATDVTLWLGDRIIAAAPGVAWTFYTAHKKATGYQRAVLTGFAAVDDPRYYVDLAHFVSRWLELALRRRAARADFLTVIATTAIADAGGAR